MKEEEKKKEEEKATSGNEAPKKPRNQAVKKSPTKHSMHRRAHFHDYNAAGTYFITLTEADRRPLFGRLIFEPYPMIELTPYGERLRSEAIPKIHEVYPDVYVWHYVIMPDHIHMILRVDKSLPEGRVLGDIIRGFKNGCNKLYRDMGGESGRGVFRNKYNDKILMEEDQLNRWHRYINDNPRRLALKKRNPELFTVLYGKEICGIKCQMVGNRFLLDYPEKMAVVVHHSDSYEEYLRHRDEWLACGERGGVLVSASVAPPEKEVCRIALERGYRLILLKDNGFPPLYKPAGRSFDACVEGRMLRISPWDYDPARKTITRDQCLYLNALAESIAATPHFGFLDE